MIAAPRHQLADQPGDHQPGQESKLVGHLEDDEDCRDRSLHHSTEACAHPADGEKDSIGIVERKEMPSETGHSGTAHAAKKQARRKYATASAEAVASDRGDQLS